MTADLAAKVRALSPDARTVLHTLAIGPQQWRSVDNIAHTAGLTEARTKAACRELGPLVCSQHLRATYEQGFTVHAEETALLARAAREVEPGLPLEEDEP